MKINNGKGIIVFFIETHLMKQTINHLCRVQIELRRTKQRSIMFRL